MRRLLRFLLLLGIASFLLLLFLPARGPVVEEGSTLVLEIGGDYVEAAEPPILSRLFADGRRPFASLLSEMRKASLDGRIENVVVRIRPLRIGWGKAQELRGALEHLSDTGHRTVALLEVAAFSANLEYYVASAADEVHISPAARAPIVGLAAEFLFLGGLWEKFGIELEVDRIGEYKTAADTFAGTEMSEAHREMANSLLDSMHAQFVEGIADGRGLTPEYVEDAIDRAPSEPDEMRALKLADGVRFYDELLLHLGANSTIQAAEYAQVDASEVGFEPVARFALIYGSGNVVQGRGSLGPAGSVVLASDTVSKALLDAAEDDDISAIIFRVDSPGGSAFASDVVWRAARRARARGKPLIASFSDVAASGGYYVACGADAIVAPGGVVTGSIGVVALRPILGGMFEKLGIGTATLTRGAHADLLLSSRRLSDGSRQVMRDGVKSIYDLFVERVAEGRSLDPKKVDEIGRGRVWTGAQALELGLIDALGGLHTAVDRAKEEIDLAPDAHVALVPFPAPRSLTEQLEDAMRRISVASAPPPLSQWLPQGALGERALHWLAALGEAGPALLPPFVLEIR